MPRSNSQSHTGNSKNDGDLTLTITPVSLLPPTATYAHIPIILLMLTQCAMDAIFFGTAFPSQIEKTFSIKLSPGQHDAANYACWGYVFSKLTMYILTRPSVILSTPPCGMPKSDPKRLNEIIKQGLQNWKCQNRNSADIPPLTENEREELKAVLGDKIVDAHFNFPLSASNHNNHQASIEEASPRCEFNIVHFIMLVGFLDASAPFITAALKSKSTQSFLFPEDHSQSTTNIFLVFTYISLCISQQIYYNYRNPNNRIIYSLLWNNFRDGPSILSKIRNACCCIKSASQESTSLLADNSSTGNYSTDNTQRSDNQPAHYFNSKRFKCHLFISLCTASVDGLFPFFSHDEAMLQYNAPPTIALMEPIGGFCLYFSTVYGNSFKGLLNPSTSTNDLQKNLPQPWRCTFNIVAVYFVMWCGASAAMVMNYTLRKINHTGNISPEYNTTNSTTTPSSGNPDLSPSIIYSVFAIGLPLLSGILTMQKIWGFSVPRAYENAVKFYDNCKKRQSSNHSRSHTHSSSQGLCQRLSNSCRNLSDSISLWWNKNGDNEAPSRTESELTPLASTITMNFEA